VLHIRKRNIWPWLTLVSVLAGAAYQLHNQGRTWFCTCGRFRIWSGSAWSAETSQQLFDPYTFTHVLHGFVLCWLLAWWAPRWSSQWRFTLAVAAEALWEVFENTEFVIRRYRETTAALGYQGDTVINSLGDILACAIGFVIARYIGIRRSIALFFLIEAVLLVFIRDSLLLNILLLLFANDGIKAWQAGH
jgi:hypothetical protein